MTDEEKIEIIRWCAGRDPDNPDPKGVDPN